MNNDHELLELAAKAAGIDGEWGDNEHPGGEGIWDCCSCWNPLYSDEQALRLAVKLGLFVECYTDMGADSDTNVLAFGPTPHCQCLGTFKEKHIDDPYVATRRAIVRAAAEIGRNMK